MSEKGKMTAGIGNGGERISKTRGRSEKENDRGCKERKSLRDSEEGMGRGG